MASDFYKYMISNHIEDDSPIGDLARDMKSDPKSKRINVPCGFHFYLVRRGASQACLDTFEDAYDEYCSWKEKQ